MSAKPPRNPGIIALGIAPTFALTVGTLIADQLKDDLGWPFLYVAACLAVFLLAAWARWRRGGIGRWWIAVDVAAPVPLLLAATGVLTTLPALYVSMGLLAATVHIVARDKSVDPWERLLGGGGFVCASSLAFALLYGHEWGPGAWALWLLLTAVFALPTAVLFQLRPAPRADGGAVDLAADPDRPRAGT